MTPCLRCAHIRKEGTGIPGCAAFPDGIPVDIFYGQRDHDQPVEGDNGITFRHEDDEPGSSVITDYLIKGTRPG